MQFSIKTDKPKSTSEKKTFSKLDQTAKLEDKNNSFLSLLESIVPSSKEETKGINELWQKLPDIEKRFLASPSQAHLEEYKNLVKDIIDEILKKNTVLTEAKKRGRNDQKILMTVKIIDQNIQILAQTMLSPNNSAFGLLKQMEKIRGLLRDIKE
jgi:uncharacterized protein